MGLDWFSVATEASGDETPDLLCVLEVLGYMELYRHKKHVRGATGATRGRGRALGGWARPHPRGKPRTLLAQLFYSMAFFWSKNKLRQVSGHMDSVWFSFFVIL